MQLALLLPLLVALVTAAPVKPCDHAPNFAVPAPATPIANTKPAPELAGGGIGATSPSTPPGRLVNGQDPPNQPMQLAGEQPPQQPTQQTPQQKIAEQKPPEQKPDQQSKQPEGQHQQSKVVAMPEGEPKQEPSPAPQQQQGGGSGGSGGGGGSLIPNGIKAGISSGNGIKHFTDSIGWWYDWSANPTGNAGPVAIPMLWGDGHLGGLDDDAKRFEDFKATTLNLEPAPKYVMGFEEPDCAAGSGSADLQVSQGAKVWDEMMGPLKAKGTVLISPSMCKQADEEWLTPFDKEIKTKWDITNVHINKLDAEGIQKVLDKHRAYGKPMLISEFACVDDQNGFTPCTDDGKITEYINTIVPILENDPDVVGYSFSNGRGLGDKWVLTNGEGPDAPLSAAGQAYLDAIKAARGGK